MHPYTLSCMLGLSLLAACHRDNTDRFFTYYTRTDTEDQPEGISGAYADLIVNLSDEGQLVFSREHSYRPVWEYGDEDRALVPHLSTINGDGPSDRKFDRRNQYTFVRLIDSDAETVTVHWRYYPDFDDLSPTGVVHELYTIHRDGRVVRTHRVGDTDYNNWNDPLNQTTQTFTLTQRGLTDLQTVTPQQSPAVTAQTGNPIQERAQAIAPIAEWRLDAGISNAAADTSGIHNGQIEGPLWKAGVSGTAMAFDGYDSAIIVDAPPNITDAVTVSAWVALSALPWNEVPILQSEDTDGDTGYALRIDAVGRPVMVVNGQEVTAAVSLPRNQWVHVVGVSGADGVALYVDGARVAEGPAAGAISSPAQSLWMGRNTAPQEASDAVRGDEVDIFHHFSSVFGLEGLLDEVQIYDVALSAAAVSTLHDQSAPSASIRSAPDLQRRALPDLETEGAQFGATHTTLAFHDLWDRQWRVTDTEDVVVRFDDAPIAFAYWRGTTHGMNAVTDGLWMSDQSVEIIIPDEEEGGRTLTLSEHMSDKQALRSHVRIIENTDARVMIHWRYGLADVFKTMVANRAYVDEIHTIYPDGIAIRDVFYHNSDQGGGREFYHDFQWLVDPDVDPVDMIDLNAVSLADLQGNTQEVTWPLSANRDDEEQPRAGNIAVLNTHTDWKVFGIAQGGGFYPAAGGAEISPHVDWDGDDFPFAGPWNHWPVAQIPSDGRFVTAYDRVAHFAVGSLESFAHGTGAMMVGFTQSDAASLVPLARSWRRAPETRRLRNLRGGEYNINRRAYEFRRRGDAMSFTIDASAASPIVNPCFVIQDWNSNQTASLTLNDQPVTARQGITVDTDGNRMLVIWAELTATTESPFAIAVD